MGAPHFHEDFGFTRRMWIVERVGWLLLAFVLVAAALGAFGTGLLSQVEAAPPDDSFEVRYPKFGRMQSPFTVRIVIPAAGKPTDRETVWIGADYLARFTIGGITPEPETVRLHGNHVAFEFLRSPLDTAAELRFSLEAEGPGIAAGEIAVGAGEAVGVWQFFYP